MTVDTTKIIAERGKTHGNFMMQATTAQQLKHVMRTTPNWPDLHPQQREALEMLATKLSRLLHGSPQHVDHWTDAAAFLGLGSPVNFAPNAMPSAFSGGAVKPPPPRAVAPPAEFVTAFDQAMADKAGRG
jgi:hypothetical protein